MLKKIFLPLVCLLSPLFVRADDPYIDNSKAGVDGPYVFYRGKDVVVKSVVRQDTSLALHKQQFADRRLAQLRCAIAETGDQFSFYLKKSLTVEDDHYKMPERMLVVSDIEGNFIGFKMILLGAKVIDENFNWNFGDGHLVLVGDFFDRGLNVTEVLWLIYKLEQEAEDAGGKVHFILGNHEILNLEGNTQYVRKKYLENAKIIEEPYSRWLDNNSELGRWLRTKNAIEKIGDYVFCHGGVSTALARTGLSLNDINKISRKYLGIPYEDIRDPTALAVFDIKSGIFWYRNAAKNMLDASEVKDIFDYVGAKRMVVGHTLQADITAYYNGRLICIDLYHEENLRQGFMKALWVVDGQCFSIDSRGETSSVFTIVLKGGRD